MKENKRKIEKEDILVPQERGKEGFGLISETEKKGLYSEGLDPGHAKINLMYKLGSKPWTGATASINQAYLSFLNLLFLCSSLENVILFGCVQNTQQLPPALSSQFVGFCNTSHSLLLHW